MQDRMIEEMAEDRAAIEAALEGHRQRPKRLMASDVPERRQAKRKQQRAARKRNR